MAQHPASARALKRLLPVLLAAGALGFLALSVLTFTKSDGWGFDFEAYYTAALRLAQGRDIYLEYTLEGPFSPGFWGIYLYAPPLAALTLPFTVLSLDAAIALWFALRVGLLMLGCAILPVRPAIRLYTFAVAAVSFPVLIDLNLGNVSVVVMVLIAVTWRWLDRPLGSIALAAAMSVRPTLGLVLIWWLFRRAWRPIAWALAAGLVLIVATLPFVGVESYQQYLTVLRNVSEMTGVQNNLDLGTTLLRFGLEPVLASIALYAGYALAIVAMLVSLRFDREVSFMVTIGATMLLAPLLWDHYLATLVLPAALLAERGRMWGLALPLLAWLPPPFLPLLAIAGTVLPFLVARRDVPGPVPAPNVADVVGDANGEVASAAPLPVPVPSMTSEFEPGSAGVAEPQVAGPMSTSNTTASPG
jgi:alpha-1,2-mannosyltransferase